MNNKATRIPNVGEVIKFFDDGKSDTFRRHWAQVLDVIPSKVIEKWEPKLYEAWQENVEENEIYAKETDYFIFCVIPTFDDEQVVFVRACDSKWFSIDYPNAWMSGLLDVDDVRWDLIKEFEGDEFLSKNDEKNWYENMDVKQ